MEKHQIGKEEFVLVAAVTLTPNAFRGRNQFPRTVNAPGSPLLMISFWASFAVRVSAIARANGNCLPIEAFLKFFFVLITA